MNRPNGIAVVTTGLGAVVLLHVIWSWDRQPEPQLGPNSPPQTAISEAGAILQFHSGAWRPQPTRVDAEPVAEPAAASVSLVSAVDMSAPVTVVSTALRLHATSATASTTTAVRSVPVQQIAPRGGPPTLPPEAEASAETATAAGPLSTTVAASPMAPPEGRMALAGPDSEAALPPTSQQHAGRSAPTGRTALRAPASAPAPEADASAPRSIESKFGPGNFKQFDRNGY
jgi:hypothetical protein